MCVRYKVIKSLQCPVCNSKNTYVKVVTNLLVCRNCGKVSKMPELDSGIKINNIGEKING